MTGTARITPERLIEMADKIDRRLGPIPGGDADRLAVVLRRAAAQLAGTPHPTGSEAFAAALALLGVPPPWRLSSEKEEIDILWAANGAIALQVDPNGSRTDQDVLALAHWIMLAVNTVTGFKAEAPEAR